MRLIDADAFEVFTYTHRNNDFDDGVQYVLEAMDNAPTIEPDVPGTNVGDMISRQAAIDALEKSGYCYDQFLGVESVLNALPSAQPEQRWIPCSERLPEEETTYLVTFASGQVGISSWHKSTKHNRGFDNAMQAVLEKGSITIYGVVAWMPLPEPYKGEQP